MCKNWIETGVCRYTNKCQFAHGGHELVGKEPQNERYKSKNCKQFFEKGFCPYGGRCLFQHEERGFNELHSYFYIPKMLGLEQRYTNDEDSTLSFIWHLEPKTDNDKRLKLFSENCNEDDEPLMKLTRCPSYTSDSFSQDSDDTKSSGSFFGMRSKSRSLSISSQEDFEESNNTSNTQIYKGFFTEEDFESYLSHFTQ